MVAHLVDRWRAAVTKGQIQPGPLGWLFRAVAQAPDFDGDGLGDLVVSEQSVPGTAVSILRGTDAVPLWTAAYPGYFLSLPFPAEDLGSGEPGVFVFHYALGANVVEALDVDGTSVWVRPYAAAGLGTGLGLVATNVSLYSPIPVGIADDANGIPGADVAVGRLVQDENVISPSLPPYVNAVPPLGFHSEPGADGLVVEVLDGATGTPSVVTGVPGANDVPDASFAGDLSGDGLEDLVLAGGAARQRILIAVRADSPAPPLWTSTFDAPPSVSLRKSADADGDDRPDVVAWSMGDPYVWDGAVTVLSGGTGTVLWSRGGEAPVVADLDSDGGADVRAAFVSRSNGSGMLSYRGWKGKDGSLIYESTYLGTEQAAENLSYRPDVGDADGDGVTDAAHEFADQRVVSGRTGATLWTGRWGLAVHGDLNGSGGEDQVRSSDSFEDGTWRSLVEALEGSTGEVIWSRTIAGTEDYGVSVAALIPVSIRGTDYPDLVIDVTRGSPGPVVLPVIGRISAFVTAFELVDGSSGTTLYEF